MNTLFYNNIYIIVILIVIIFGMLLYIRYNHVLMTKKLGIYEVRKKLSVNFNKYIRNAFCEENTSSVILK
jgi:hypothetical protein